MYLAGLGELRQELAEAVARLERARVGTEGEQRLAAMQLGDVADRVARRVAELLTPARRW